MENTNQQIPPIPDQQEIKASNNLSFFRTLAYGFVIVSIGVSIAIGGYLLGANKTKPQPVAQTSVTPSTSPTPDPTANWKTYINESYGFEIKYPNDWIVQDKLRQKPEKAASNNNLELSNSSLPESPKFILFINPLGFGLPIPDKVYELSPAKDGKLEIINRQEIAPIKEGMTNIDGHTIINSKTFEIDNNSYLFTFDFVQGGKDYEPILNQILSTFKFTETKNPYITVISPNGGEKWKTGETHAISWTSNNVSNVIIVLNQGASRSFLIGPKTGVRASLGKFDWKPENSAFFAGRNDLKIIVMDAAYCSYVDESTGIECAKDEISHGDTSDSYFSIVSANLSLPTTCEDKPEGLPVITSLSDYSGSIGAKIEIRGCNFSGFEGDKTAWIENEQAVKGILYGEEGSTSKILKVTLKSPLCQNNNSYSGLPCNAWLTLNTGTYKIYTSPWNKKSNEANFTIK